jgi:hypothetical protein
MANEKYRLHCSWVFSHELGQSVWRLDLWMIREKEKNTHSTKPNTSSVTISMPFGTHTHNNNSSRVLYNLGYQQAHDILFKPIIDKTHQIWYSLILIQAIQDFDVVFISFPYLHPVQLVLPRSLEVILEDKNIVSHRYALQLQTIIYRIIFLGLASQIYQS